MKLKFISMETNTAETYRNGGLDANGQLPEHTVSDGNGNPCRHCQKDIAAGKSMLVLSYRPFSKLQPYAEAGPIFFCGETCFPERNENLLPQAVTTRAKFLVRGYDQDERIIGGTGRTISTLAIIDYVSQLMKDKRVASVHLRSVSNNCYFGAIKRAE